MLSSGSAPQVRIRDASRVLCPVPIVQRQLWIDLPQHLLQPVHDFAMPRQELRPKVNVSGLVNLILLEPEGDPARDGVRSSTREHYSVQLDQGISQQRPF
jgi:hypothetical protein